jgi:hypothetical protein
MPEHDQWIDELPEPVREIVKQKLDSITGEILEQATEVIQILRVDVVEVSKIKAVFEKYGVIIKPEEPKF